MVAKNDRPTDLVARKEIADNLRAIRRSVADPNGPCGPGQLLHRVGRGATKDQRQVVSQKAALRHSGIVP